MQTISRAILALAMFTLVGCASTFEATYDHDPSNDFSGYRDFAWISEHPMKVGETASAVSPLLEGKIMRSLEVQLGAKGYTLVSDPGTADFVVSFTIGSREKIKVDSYPSMSMGYRYGYPSHWGWGASYYCCAQDTRVREYTKGMLAVDMFDVDEHRPVWHGVATKSITDADRKNVDATVDAAVAAILEGFPPP